MKTNFLKVSFMALAATVIASCSQENEVMENIAPEETTGQTLKIKASAAGFEAADAQTRATDDGAATVFENGDQMGLYIVQTEGESQRLVMNNVPLTYDGSTWQADRTIYYYENADYIAYFPYKDDISASAASVATDIKTAFDAYLEANATGQSDIDVYRNADLMTATITASELSTQEGEDKTLNFQLKHSYSMVQLTVPVHKFNYTYKGETRTMSVPMSDFEVKIGEQIVSPCHLGDGVYRMLVQPGDISLSGSFEDPKDLRPVEFDNATATTKTLAAGSYIGYNVTYDGAPTGEATPRSIIGDYFCQDGTIYPADFLSAPSNVIGIIFSTVDDTDTDNAAYGYYALSIRERGSMKFYSSDETANESDAAKADIEAITNYSSDTEENFKTALTDMNGFSWTNAIRELSYNITTDLTSNWVNNADFAAPSEGTSGWFIPSIGQWVKVSNVLGSDGSDYTLEEPTYNSDKDKFKLTYGTTTGQVTNKFETIHSTLNSKVPITNAATTLSGCYWSLTEATSDGTNSQNYCLDLSNGKFEITLQDKTSKRILRPILAF